MVQVDRPEPREEVEEQANIHHSSPPRQRLGVRLDAICHPVLLPQERVRMDGTSGTRKNPIYIYHRHDFCIEGLSRHDFSVSSAYLESPCWICSPLPYIQVFIAGFLQFEVTVTGSMQIEVVLTRSVRIQLSRGLSPLYIQ